MTIVFYAPIIFEGIGSRSVGILIDLLYGTAVFTLQYDLP